MIHAFVDYRRDYKLYIVKGHRYWDQQFIVRSLYLRACLLLVDAVA